jgi:hypothetical protein
MAGNIAAEYRPTRALVIWNGISVVSLAIFALGFLALRLA